MLAIPSAVSLLGPNGLKSVEDLGDVALGELRVLVVSLRTCNCLSLFFPKINWNYSECGVWPRPRSEYLECIESPPPRATTVDQLVATVVLKRLRWLVGSEFVLGWLLVQDHTS